MKSRLALLSATVLACAAPLALAQNPPPPPAQGGMGGMGGQGGFGQRRMQMMLNGITLTPQQQSQLDSIQAQFRSRMPAFTPGQRPDSAAMVQRRQVMAQQDSTIRAILTPEQQQVWDRNAEQMRNAMPRRGPGGPG